jgi:DNA-binding transcriptional LysR family regulator
METVSLDLLRALVAVAESKNMVEAARKMGLSQPALSFQLKKLETSVPLPIFSFEGKRKVLTHYGRSLYRTTRRQLNRLDLALEKVNRRYGSAENLTLKIGTRREIFPRIADQLRFPGKIKFIALPTHRAVLRLLEHSLDLAISHEVPDLSEIIAKKLFSNGVKLVVHKKWIESLGGENSRKPLSSLAKSPEFLGRVPALSYRDDAPFLTEWAQAAGMTIKDFKIKYVCEDWNTVMSLVESGSGFSIVPEDISTQNVDILSFPIPKSVVPEVTYFVLYHRDLRKIPIFRNFLEI